LQNSEKCCATESDLHVAVCIRNLNVEIKFILVFKKTWTERIDSVYSRWLCKASKSKKERKIKKEVWGLNWGGKTGTYKGVDGKIDLVYVRAMNLKGQQIKAVTNKRYKNLVNRANHILSFEDRFPS